ncbi:MAG: exonuclease SbcCD subunit D, partial [Dehalococcoidia bacterium]
MTTRKKIRLIHTSDTHLGSDWRPDIVADAFRAVVDGVAELQGDALLVVGDVFDHARIPDDVLQFFLNQIRRLSVPAVVLPGNHDLYDHKSLYFREPFQDPPDNFHLFTSAEGEIISLPELTLDLWGRAMPSHIPEFRPLANMPAARNG